MTASLVEPQDNIVPRDKSEDDRAVWLARYQQIRRFTKKLWEPLATEDFCIQSMPDASPVRWHIAHTTWFFETFILQPFAEHIPSNKQFRTLFNSYYNAVGEQFPRHQRGMISRPSIAEILGYREEIDHAMNRYIEQLDLSDWQQLSLLQIGLQHEQQHQELILTDIKHALWINPLGPAYHPAPIAYNASASDNSHIESCGLLDSASWKIFDGGVVSIGVDKLNSQSSVDAFNFDNEEPRHRVFLEPFSLCNSLVTNAEYQSFIDDKGYQRSEFWLSEGWATVQNNAWAHPLYWRQSATTWQEFTLSGWQAVQAKRPVCHLSYFEADAFARWAGKRLPTEAEWEFAAASEHSDWQRSGYFCDHLLEQNLAIAPQPETSEDATCLMGNLWQWTSSGYNAYPGFTAAKGAVGEYNGKFMCNQYVLRGGSVASSSNHLRPTYRNFFPTTARWQFAGVRLAKSNLK